MLCSLMYVRFYSHPGRTERTLEAEPLSVGQPGFCDLRRRRQN
jgi:hypothetical protein